MSKPICIYAGYIVRYPLGGHVLAELHYIVGLQRLGYDVVFVEESGTGWNPCYDPLQGEMTADPGYGIGVLQEVLRLHGLDRNWCYVDAQRRYHGLSADELRGLCRKAALVFSRSNTTWLDEFYECKRRVFVDVDPAFTQFRMSPAPTPSCSGYASPYDFQFYFSYGERIGRKDCPIPTRGLNWRPTRAPIVLDLLPKSFTPDAMRFSTVLSWSSYGAVQYNGQTYGQKDVELLKLLALPSRVGPIFEIALAGPNAPVEKLREAGWIFSGAREATLSVPAYLEFIGRSRGEFSVAKHGYVITRCGWFSDRTANYLATGKPAIVQDTGFSEHIPCGEGLFAFTRADEVVAAVEAINQDYRRHCDAARRIAQEYFSSVKVLGALLRQCDLPAST
jgi:hypothetical protein